MDDLTLSRLTARACDLMSSERRTLLGVAGPPGAGKTTFARALVARLRLQGVPVAHVPMDGFHLADVTLRDRGLLEQKGAIGTFDAQGYLAMLERLRAELCHDVFAPDFERRLEQPLAQALTVHAGDRLVVTEGNYLLDTQDPWPSVRQSLDAVWFVDVDPQIRRERLTRRHVEFGKSRAEAVEWVELIDEPNAHRIMAGRDAADLVIDGAGL